MIISELTQFLPVIQDILLFRSAHNLYRSFLPYQCPLEQGQEDHDRQHEEKAAQRAEITMFAATDHRGDLGDGGFEHGRVSDLTSVLATRPLRTASETLYSVPAPIKERSQDRAKRRVSGFVL